MPEQAGCCSVHPSGLAERSNRFPWTSGLHGGILGLSTISSLRIWHSSVRSTRRFESKSLNRSLNSLFTDEDSGAQREAETCPGSHSTKSLQVSKTVRILYTPSQTGPWTMKITGGPLTKQTASSLEEPNSPALRLSFRPGPTLATVADNRWSAGSSSCFAQDEWQGRPTDRSARSYRGVGSGKYKALWDRMEQREGQTLETPLWPPRTQMVP